MRLRRHAGRRHGGGAGGAHGKKDGPGRLSPARRRHDLRRPDRDRRRQRRLHRRPGPRSSTTASASMRGFRPSEAETDVPRPAQGRRRAGLFRAPAEGRDEGRRRASRRCGPRTAIAFKAGVFVDATYEGDLLAAAGVSFHVGREGNAQYGETHNGVFFGPGHTFSVKVDPYKEEGKKDSGLLWGISAEPPGEPGQGDKKVQAYNFRMWLTDAAGPAAVPQAGRLRPRPLRPAAALPEQAAQARDAVPARPRRLQQQRRLFHGLHRRQLRLAGGRLRHARENLPGPRQLSAGPDVVHGQRPGRPRRAADEGPRLRPAEGRVHGNRRLAARAVRPRGPADDFRPT